MTATVNPAGGEVVGVNPASGEVAGVNPAGGEAIIETTEPAAVDDLVAAVTRLPPKA